MNHKFITLLSTAIIPQVVKLIVEREGLDDLVAMNEFYQSQVYDLLSKEETKVWHYSPMTVYMMWRHEKETGEIVFPED